MGYEQGLSFKKKRVHHLMHSLHLSIQLFSDFKLILMRLGLDTFTTCFLDEKRLYMQDHLYQPAS